MKRTIHKLAVLLAVGLMASGCVTSRAQIPEPQPTLVVPPVPPRAIEPPPAIEPPAAPLPAEPPPTTTTNTRPRQRAQAEAKPDPKQEPPVEPVAAPLPPVAPLRTSTTPTGPEATRQIRETIDATQKMLDRVDSLQSDDRKANFTLARDLLQQADEALKKEELTQAQRAADRALNIAKLLLSGR